MKRGVPKFVGLHSAHRGIHASLHLLVRDNVNSTGILPPRSNPGTEPVPIG
jgi:hypothetical protein